MRATGKPFHIFLVGTAFFSSTGGIQYVNRLLLQVLLEFGRSTPCTIEAFSYGDLTQAFPASFLGSDGTRWHAFGRSRSAMAWSLASRLKAVSPHLVLFTHVDLLQLAWLVRVLAPQARLAVLGHGVEVWQPLAPAVVRPALQQADAVVAPSDFTCQQLIEANQVDPDRITIIPHGLDPAFTVDNRQGLKISRSGRMLLSVARLVGADAEKGVDLVLRAMPLVLERCPEARYVVVGDGDDRPRLMKMADELAVRDRVEFRGEISDMELMRAYAEADVFVLPSKKEGFGIVFLEAMWNRLPVVAARFAGTLDVVADGITGILVPPDNRQHLASALTSLLLLPEEREAMGAAGRLRVEQNFLFRHFAGRWQRWIARLTPEAIYLARHAAAFARLPAVAGLPASAFTPS
jgi:glycosyltransferase involved in cell wall biosynthesis